jgi:hypothetical protein
VGELGEDMVTVVYHGVSVIAPRSASEIKVGIKVTKVT